MHKNAIIEVTKMLTCHVLPAMMFQGKSLAVSGLKFPRAWLQSGFEGTKELWGHPLWRTWQVCPTLVGCERNHCSFPMVTSFPTVVTI